MSLVRLDHIQLAMPAGEEERAVGFYRDVLGLSAVSKPEPLRRRGGCWFESGELKVHLGVEEDFRPARKAHPAFVVRDLPTILHRARAAGSPVTEAESHDDFAHVYVEDPFGNRLELLAPGADRVAARRRGRR